MGQKREMKWNGGFYFSKFSYERKGEDFFLSLKKDETKNEEKD